MLFRSGGQLAVANEWVMEELPSLTAQPGSSFPEPFRTIFNGWHFATHSGTEFYYRITEADTTSDTKKAVKEWEDEIDDIQQKIMAWKGSESVHRAATAVVNRYIAAKEQWHAQRRAWEEGQASTGQ